MGVEDTTGCGVSGIPMVCKSTSTYPVPCSHPLRTLDRDIAWETTQLCKRLRQADSHKGTFLQMFP